MTTPNTEDTELKSLLKTVVDHFNEEDRATRERQIRQWRRLKLYWNNFSQIYWSEVAQDYRIHGRDDTSTESADQEYYDRPVNVFKAFLETIIAALSIQIPAVSCIPDDADNPNDLSTAKAGDKIATLVYKHNNVIFLWLHALYIYCTEGMIACYSYPREDKEYGTIKKPKYKDEEIESYICPICEERVPDEVFSDAQLDKYGVGEEDVELDRILLEKGPVCPVCGELLSPELQKQKLKVKRLVGETSEPKTRICLDVYGGLYIKVANYAKKQSDTPYLIFAYETHYVNPLTTYPHLRDNMPQDGWSNIGINDPYEQYGRVNTQYAGELPENNVTVKNCWLRPAAFNILEETKYKKLKKKFPDGVKVVFVNDICAEYCPEKLDDHWTLTKNPMSDYLTHEPLGELLTNIQDIVNDLISLTLQTIEHGIAQTFVDPAVIDLAGQNQVEAAPGTLTATKPVAGNKNIGEAFFTSKQAALSPEVFSFYRIVQELGQFVSGALPSLFGGAPAGGTSKTASEYAMSKSMAMQRLQTPWKMINIWWKDIFGKVIPMYMTNVEQDERYVEKNEQGNFINTFIRIAELQGTIGSIELDSSEQLPITEEQQKEMVMQLMQLNNEILNMAIISPENLPMLRKVVRIPDFNIPGEDDRQKQYEEINQLINSEPQEMPPDEEMLIQASVEGIPPEEVPPVRLPSVEIDVDIDNHEIEAEICRGWLISEAGRLAKIENPPGYENVLLHFKAHLEVVQMRAAEQAMMAAEAEQEQTSGKKPPTKKAKQSEKITGESDARTPVS